LSINSFFVAKQKVFPSPAPATPGMEGVENQVFRVPFEDYVANLVAIKQLGDQKGFQTLIMTLPHEFPYEPERNPYIRQAAQEGKIPLLDLFHIMKVYQAKGEALYTPDGGHPNVAGHRHIAEQILQKMREMGLLPSPAS